MYTQQFKAEQWLPVSIEQAWVFFSSPGNLAQITPPDLGFKVLSQDLNNRIYNGMLIDYSVKPLFGIKMKWKTEILHVEEYKSFTDKQIKGPYRLWEHTHYFEEKDGGVWMTDVVKYQVPLGLLGLILNGLLIRPRIESIFKYRTSTLNKIFG